MATDTKERILNTALKMFSEKGYEGTNIRELLAELGLTKAAFYKHYESKAELKNALLDRMEAYYAENFGSIENMPEIPKSYDELLATTMEMVNFTIHDERIVLTRKLLLAEQFHDERVKKLATKHFISGTKDIFKHIFEKMMENGLLKQEDPDVLAFAFTSPITSLIHYCDREPEKEPEIIKQIETLVDHFISVYSKKG